MWRPGRWLIAAAMVALTGYLIVDLWVFPLETRMPDEKRFVGEAVAFARTGEFWVRQQRAWEMPLTGLVYGVIYKAVGTETALIAVARCLQALLLVLQAWLCADLARRLFSKPAASAIALVGVLAYPMFVAFQSLLLSEALFIFLLVLAIWCLYVWATAPANTRWLAAYAAAMAAATYTKASLTFLPLVLPLLVIRSPFSWREAARVLAITALILMACLSPWWIRNYRLFDQPVWFTTGGTSTLYLGNNPANLTAGIDSGSDVEQPFVTALQHLPELERDRRYRDRAIDYIKANPIRFAENAVRKFVRFWNIIPNHPMWRQGAYLWIVALSYGPVLLLALLGAWIYRRQWRWFLPIYGLMAYFTLLHTVTIASLRYRLPLDPFLVVFAAGATAALLANSATCHKPRQQRIELVRRTHCTAVREWIGSPQVTLGGFHKRVARRNGMDAPTSD